MASESPTSNHGNPSVNRRTSKNPMSARSRPRASIACVSCRQKKTKCDALNLQPGESCSMCKNSNIECVVIRNSDRRKHGSKDHITALQGRMESLEALLSQFGANQQKQAKGVPDPIALQSPQATPSPTTIVEENEESDESLKLVSQDQQDDAISLENVQNQDVSQTDEPNQPTFEEFHLVSETTPKGGAQIRTEAQDEFFISRSPGTMIHESHEHGIEEHPPSLGPDSSPGQVRYYGPTTQLHIQSQPENDLRTSSEYGHSVNFVIDMDSPQLRDVLLNSCWNYYLRSVTVVDPQLFMSHRSTGKRSQYYSSFVEDALLACSTRISTSSAVRKLGRAYAERAKQDIANELEQPTIATLQGFLLLSDFEATAARDRVGWTYNGIACRLIFDLGLHEDCSRLVKHAILSELDLHLRDSLLLSAFVYDRLWALYLGRPSCVPRQVVASKNLFNATPESKENTLHHWVHLCDNISELTDILNGFGQELDRSVADRLSDIGLRISKAHEALPPRLSSEQMPNLDVTAYGLNMQFCGIQIVLHRALVKIFSQQGEMHLNTDTTAVERSRIIMYNSSACICRLTLAFREIFGIENFITVMLDNMYIAASTLISHIVQPPLRTSVEGSLDEAFNYLNVIAETIQSLQSHYPVAEKMRRTLARICGNTPLAGMFGVAVGMQTTPPTCSEIENLLLQPIGGSWGSMEALVHDDSILSQSNFLGEDFQVDLGMPDLNMTLLP